VCLDYFKSTIIQFSDDFMIKRETIYYEEGGPDLTETTLQASLDTAKELGIKNILVASTSGETGVKAAEMFQHTDLRLIVVGHQMGFPVAKVQQFKPENWEKIEALGGIVNLGTDVITNSIRRRRAREPLVGGRLSVLINIWPSWVSSGTAIIWVLRPVSTM
jgi:hypothetical protein